MRLYNFVLVVCRLRGNKSYPKTHTQRVQSAGWSISMKVLLLACCYQEVEQPRCVVPVGNYDVKVEMSGFKTGEVRGLRVETAAQVRQDFQLQIGAVSETVEVAASTVLLNTETANVGGVIENKRIIELPLNGRNVVSLAVLVPGVQFGERTGRGDGLGGFPIPGASFSVSANGVRETFRRPITPTGSSRRAAGNSD